MTIATNTPNVTIRANAALAAELAARGEPLGAALRRDIERYYEAIAATLGEIGLSEPEWNYLRDLLNGSLLDASTARYLWAEVEDAEPEIADKWGIDARDLSGRIRTLPTFSRLAICDAVERWWRAIEATKETTK